MLAAIGARWRHAHLAALRARAHYWGLKQQADGSPPELSVLEQEHERFTQEFDETTHVVQAFLEMADQHIPFLLRKAERIEEYLQQR